MGWKLNPLTGQLYSDSNSGTPGANGESAYQTALDNGFVGTEAEWLLSLKGVKGDPGNDGVDGSPGTNGTNGSNGAPGYTPVKGIDYFDGAQGAQGIQGIQGVKGDTGDTGATGAPGAPGTTSWAGITDKPSTFTPSAHSHVKADITDFDHTHTELHTHANKTLLDTYTQTELNLADAVTNKHTRLHSITDTSDHSFPGGTTNFLRADGTFAAPGGGSDPFTFKGRTLLDVTSASVTPTALTGLVFTFEAMSFYVVEFFAFGTSLAATTGHSFAIDTSVAVNAVGLNFFHQLANTGTLTGGSSIADNTRTGLSSGVPTLGALTPIYGSGLVQTSALTGTAQLMWAPEVAASATIKAGAVMRVMKIT